jgi:dihydroflavonol-4-reductase
MRILVTGATGLLGSNLVRLLLSKNYQVSVFLQIGSFTGSLEGLNIKRYYGDILNTESLENAVEQNDVVIHAAAITELWPSRSKFIRDVNIIGTKNVIDAVLKFNLKRMIYIGSASSFNTTSISNSEFPGAKYGLDYIDSKYEALNLVLNAVRINKLPALAILPTFMIGPYDYKPSSGKLILALAQKKLRYYSDGGKNFIHVRDVATAIVNSIEMGRIGKYYIAGNENLTYQRFFKKVCKIVRIHPPTKKIPARLVLIIGFFGSLFGRIFNINPVISYPVAKISCDYQYVSSDDTIKELLMPQTNIDIAIYESYEWIKKNNHLN